MHCWAKPGKALNLQLYKKPKPKGYEKPALFFVLLKKTEEPGQKRKEGHIMKGRKKFLKAVLCLLVVVPAAFGTAASGAILNVPSDDHPTIQAALDVAAIGDEVLVADGTYTGSGNVNLVVDQEITIRSQNGPNLCIIDCQGNGRAFTFTDGATTKTRLSGFTIIGGNVAGIASPNMSDYSGGGILCKDGAAPTIENCIIGFTEDNIAFGNSAKYGGGIACISSSPVISNCRIEANKTSLYGGGIACISSSPVISNCHIEGNLATAGAGGLYCGSSSPPMNTASSPLIIGCTITRNSGGNAGGGVYVFTSTQSSSQSSPSISSCMITGNSASSIGGALYCKNSSPLISNCTVADNGLTNSSTMGGGFYIISNSNPIIANAILWNNSATTGPEIYLNSGSTLKVSYSIVKGGKAAVAPAAVAPATLAPIENAGLDWVDNTNQDVDPGFVGEGDYHLLPASPCVDAGTKEGAELSEYDLDGDLRISGSSPDIGADETRYIVKIDVRPGSRHDKIDLRAWGFLPVAVLSTPDFDATSIDPETVEFAGAKPLHSIRAHVNRDRRADMLFFFWIRHLDFGLDENSTQTTTTTEVALFGDSKERGSIIGTDTVTFINPKHKKHWWHKFEQMSHKKGQCNSK
jgi:hypothetical protein